MMTTAAGPRTFKVPSLATPAGPALASRISFWTILLRALSAAAA